MIMMPSVKKVFIEKEVIHLALVEESGKLYDFEAES